ncbi:unnamed protein product [Onchocerca flexuosa]|uniref:Outer membrane protein n=1 Tax=Onchocerca flexuosa TaxID=387005 RepID=A0A183H627_9BILA|nr:unnamed protein product [Onchocerca flexuosa]
MITTFDVADNVISTPVEIAGLLASPTTKSGEIRNISTSSINGLGTEKSMYITDTLPALAEVKEEGL